MSARWRRNKKRQKRFNTVTRYRGARENKIARMFRAKNSKSKWWTYPYKRVAPKSLTEKRLKWMEPLIDVLEDKDEIIVVAGLAGFKREDLKVLAKQNQLILSAEAVDRKYRKSLSLPGNIIPGTMRTTYKNGVLEIRLKKAVEEKTLDKIAG
ncbi:MAG: Hsp20/alpha crystallin family protein [Candidatus Bathycorpusculaceae bacterium]